jgi:hypothetical protein
MTIGEPLIPGSHDGAGSTPTPGLSPKQVAAAAAGNAIELYDFVTYAFFATQIGHTFFPSDNVCFQSIVRGPTRIFERLSKSVPAVRR